jgi:hypothetical protein
MLIHFDEESMARHCVEGISKVKLEHGEPLLGAPLADGFLRIPVLFLPVFRELTRFCPSNCQHLPQCRFQVHVVFNGFGIFVERL